MLTILLSIIVVLTTYLLVSYRRNLARVGGMPGLKQFIGYGHPLLMARLIPKRILGYEIFPYRDGFSWKYQHKEVYAPLKQDVISFVSYESATVLFADGMFH